MRKWDIWYQNDGWKEISAKKYMNSVSHKVLTCFIVPVDFCVFFFFFSQATWQEISLGQVSEPIPLHEISQETIPKVHMLKA